MFSKDDEIAHVVSREGVQLGVFIPQPLWEKLKDDISACMEKLCSSSEQCEPEPLEEWESLKSYWDFKYPYCADVTCAACGSQTNDWESDTPRKFRLLAANLGGFVRFECLNCKARVSKRHFKDHMEFNCIPSKGL